MGFSELDQLLNDLKPYLNQRAYNALSRAHEHCTSVVDNAAQVITGYLEQEGIAEDEVCFVAIGSVGRFEALEASDLDLIPVLRNRAVLEQFRPHDQAIRKLLQDELRLKVSRGEDLTKCAGLCELIDQAAIGGEKDDGTVLTKRILVLTEGVQAGGSFCLGEIRKKILDAYAGAERTRGRHVLSLCNDLARYYRTLCIEYKAKVDNEDKDWCTRNIKLRHSRKFWYFSLILAIVTLAESHPDGEEAYIEGLLAAFELPPHLRIFRALGKRYGIVLGDLFERFAWYLEFMAETAHRKALAATRHSQRYEPVLGNPFPHMKLNSDMISSDMIRIISTLDGYMRQRVFEWFLL